MRPRTAKELVLSCTLALTVLATTASNHTPRIGVPSAATTTVQWRGSELIAPLPEDPQARAVALQRVRELNADRPGRTAQAEDVPLLRSQAALPVQVPARPHTPRPPAETHQIPGLLTFFEGIVDNGVYPANPDIAAGANHVVMTAGNEFGVYDKCGTWQDGGDINTYFPVPANIQFSNGRVVYDDWDSRWVMSFVGNTFAGAAFIYVFVSNNSNPLSGWYFYGLTVTFASEYPDDVHIAVDPDVFYFTFDRLDLAGGFITDAGIYYVDKADLYANAAVTTLGYDGMTHLPDFVPAVGIRPTQLRTYDGNMYFVGCNIDGGNTLNIRTILDPLGTPSLVNTVVNVPAYVPPPNGQQADNTYIETGDARFTDIVYFGATIYATRIFESGGLPAVYTQLIDPVAPAHITSLTSTGSAATAIDIDESGALTRAWSSFSTATYPIASYSVLDVQPLVVHDSGIFASPQGAYQQGGFGTNAVPYQLADHFGAALDPTDRRTVWIVGASSGSPAGTWRSVIGAVSRFSEANLQVTNFPPALAGPAGGPFTGSSYTFTLTNNGNTTANWQVASAPSWLTAGAMSGALTPGAFQDVTFVLNGSAYTLPPGIYNASVTFDNCTGSGASPAPVTLGVAEPLDCALPEIDLRDAGGPTAVSTPSANVGMFVTAIGDIDVCAVSIDHRSTTVANDITVEIYEADGNVRGALVASTTTVIVDTGMVAHVIPIAVQLAACQDYEIFVTRSSSGEWNEYSGIPLPYDVGAAVRVRGGRQGGTPSSTLPGISLYGDCVGCTLPGGVPFDIGKLSGPWPPPSTAGPGALASGAYIQIGNVSQIYSIGVRADIPNGQPITASVYDASSGARGALIASGNIVANQGGGTHWHDVPLAMTSVIGDQYEIEITCPQVTSYGYWDDTSGLPYTSYGAITVNDGVVGGSPDQSDLIYMRVHMCDEVLTAVGGQTPVRVPMRLAPPVPNPASGSVALGYDMTESAVADMRIYDAKGRHVADVFTARQLRPGPGMARFDASRLAAGVYFVRMQTGAATQTAKLVVVR